MLEEKTVHVNSWFPPGLLHISSRNLPAYILRLRALNPCPLLQRSLHSFNAWASEPFTTFFFINLHMYVLIPAYKQKLCDLHLILTKVTKQQQKLIRTFLYFFKMSWWAPRFNNGKSAYDLWKRGQGCSSASTPQRFNIPLFRLEDYVSHNTFGECHQSEPEPSHFTNT